MENEVTISIPKDFSRFPSGRTPADSKYSGEAFRDKHLYPQLNEGKRIVVELDGAVGYGSSFLEEAFGGLVRVCGFTAEFLAEKLSLKTYDQILSDEIWSYIQAA